MLQQPFEFPLNESYLEADFIISSSNEEAFNFLENWQQTIGKMKNALSKIVIIYGNKACGKTHLAHIWQQQHNAKFINGSDLIINLPMSFIGSNDYYILEDFDKFMPEIAVSLFHLINIIAEKNKFLLLTSSIMPSNMNITLADLASRLNAIYQIELKNPDDELLKALLIKNFSDRQIKIDINVINYLLTRIERSFSAACHIVELIDKKSLTEKRNITIKLVKDIV